MWPSRNEYWPVESESGWTCGEAATQPLQAPLAVECSVCGTRDAGEAAADLQHLGIALCVVSTLMMGSAATFAFFFLF